MTENEPEQNENVLVKAISLATDDDHEPRVYLLVMPMDNGVAVRPIMIPKKVYMSLVSKMNKANKVLSETIKNHKAGEEINVAGDLHKLFEAISGDGEEDSIDESGLHIKTKVTNWERMYQ